MWELVLNYTQTLEMCGCERFTETHPKLAIGHLMKRLTSDPHKKRLLIAAHVKSDEKWRCNFKAFVKELASEPKVVDRRSPARKCKTSSPDFSEFEEPGTVHVGSGLTYAVPELTVGTMN